MDEYFECEELGTFTEEDGSHSHIFNIMSDLQIFNRNGFSIKHNFTLTEDQKNLLGSVQEEVVFECFGRIDY